MVSTPIVLVLLGIGAVLGLTGTVFAQTVPPAASPTPPDAQSIGGGAAVVITLVALLVIVAAGVKLYDLRRKREAEAVHLQAQVSDALLRESALFGLPITPTAHVPTWTGSPAVLEVAGQVPTAEARETALRVIRAEAARIRPDVRIEDRMAVVPAMGRRVA